MQWHPTQHFLFQLMMRSPAVLQSMGLLGAIQLSELLPLFHLHIGVLKWQPPLQCFTTESMTLWSLGWFATVSPWGLYRAQITTEADLVAAAAEIFNCYDLVAGR